MEGSGGGGSGGGGGGEEVEKKKPPEGEPKVKRKMKTASQLELLEKTYAKENYPSESLRAELSVKLGLSDRQLQMWFCHRRLKDRKAPPAKKQRKDSSPAMEVGPSGGTTGDEMLSGEVGNELISVSGQASSSFGRVDSQQRLVHRAGTALARIGPEMPAMKRYYEPPQAISELRAIAFVEAQLGEALREDGPILGMEFDPLPPGAFGAPIVTASQQKTAGRPLESKLYERSDAKPMKGSTRALQEYQFLPEQPSVRNDTYERANKSHYYSSPTEAPSARTSLSSGWFMHGNEQVPAGYGIQGHMPSLSLLPQQPKQGHLLPSTSGEYDIVPRKDSFASITLDTHFGVHPVTGLDNPFIPSERRASNEDEVSRMERKRKSDEARIAREVEAHEKRIRKELEKQDVLRRKREEQMRKEMERQDRERKREEERLMREKQREEERYQREQRREMERREKFLQKESVRAEKLRLKEEMRREKEAARLKAANDRAAARRIAKESMELIEDERLELMELVASSKGLASVLALDSETLQNLELYRDMLTEFPPKSVRLKRPFSIPPWTDSEENVGNLLMVWRFLITFADVLGLWPFTLDEFVQAFHDFDPRLLGEIHVALLRCIIKDIEDVARTPSTVLGANQNSAANPGGGHPHIVEGAYAWGFDIRSWQSHLNPLTWPEILRQFALSAGFGPKLKKRSIDQSNLRDENEGNDGEDVISNLRNGAAAENAVAIMQERGFSNPRRSRHRLTPGTVKFAAFHVLSLEGSKGLTILDVAEKIQKSGLRDLTTSKTPEASIAAALSRDTKLFERTAPSTYCVRAPYRKDPADADAILSAARGKIQIFKNGCFDEGDGDDAERGDDGERDDDSESETAEDPEVDDLGDESKSNEEALISCQENKSRVKTSSGNEKENFNNEFMDVSPGDLGNSKCGSTLMNSEGFNDVKSVGVSGNSSVDLTEIHKDETCLNQEDTVVDESNSGEPWVQGLMEGEYSDLSVEERLIALVALIGVANEGNSIRIVLEERLEAANALKKQMWAEAQLDKRRLKEEYVVKMQYSSYFVNKAEQSLASTAVESGQSPLLAVDDKSMTSTNSLFQQEHLGIPHGDLNYPNNIPPEKNMPIQECYAGPDNLPQQAGYAAEKSRSQLKALIGHRAEEMYVYRSLPLGQDRRRNRYWQFITSVSRNDPGSGKIFVELRDDFWRLIDSEEEFDVLLESLDIRGVRESHLHSMLQKVEDSFKGTIRINGCNNGGGELGGHIKTQLPGSVSNPNCVGMDSPSSSVCASNSDTPETSSFTIGIGRNEIEKKGALKRYQDFEKWMSEECYNSPMLCAIKYGKRRDKELLSICGNCGDLYFFDDSQYPCHRNYGTCVSSLNFSEHEAQCQLKIKRDPDKNFSRLHSLAPLRIRLLKTHLASIEASVLAEALQPAWTENYRRSWGVKLHCASSAEDLLQILTLLEGVLKRDFLSPNYETTNELLGSSHLTGSIVSSSSCVEHATVLPWVPLTTSAVALRLMELDASICYTLDQKAEFQKDKTSMDFMTPLSKYSVEKSIQDDELALVPSEAGSFQQVPWADPGSGNVISSGRGQGLGRGRGRVRGGRSQRRATELKSGTRKKSTTANSNRFGQFLGWKGQPRGRGGSRRGRRSVRSRPKPVKKVTETAIEGRNARESYFGRTPRSTGRQEWSREETPMQVEDAENASTSGSLEYDEDNGQAMGNEYDDMMVDNYSNIFDEKSEHLQRGVDYGPYGDDDRAGEGEDDDIDDDDDEGEEDEQGDVDVDGYFNGNSDEDEANRGDMGEDQVGNLDEITGSTSSEEYSD